MTGQSALPTIALYVRSLAPDGSIAQPLDLIHRLESLVATERIQGFSVHVVGRGIMHEQACLNTEVGQRLVEQLINLDRWAERNDASVPGIRTRKVEPSPLRDMEYTVTSIPEALVLEYNDTQLQWVSPVSVRGTHYSVWDHLDVLAQQDTNMASIRSERTPVSVSSVPENTTAVDTEQQQERSDGLPKIGKRN